MAPCSALGCKNRHSMKLKGITYHTFPRDPHRRQQWLLAMGRGDWTPSRWSHLCSVHFEEHMFDRTLPLLTRLSNTAVPTIFEGLPPIENQEFLEVKMEVLDNISNDKNQILVVPEGLDVQATFDNSDNKNNLIIIKDKKDLQTVLHYGNEDDIDGNRAIIVSDGSNIKTEWCGNDGEYDPNFGEESLKSDFMDHSEIRNFILYDPDFYVGRVKILMLKIKKFQKKKKVLVQKSRRNRRRIAELQTEVHRMKKYALPPKCSTQPIVHVISKVVSD